MQKLLILIYALALSFHVQANGLADEKPVQHMKVPDVTSMAEAERIFTDKTAELKAMQKLDRAELNQIHIITYTLEKAVAYFVENLTGEKQKLMQEIAVVVEDIHIHSENNRPEQTGENLDQYFELVARFTR